LNSSFSSSQAPEGAIEQRPQQERNRTAAQASVEAIAAGTFVSLLRPNLLSTTSNSHFPQYIVPPAAVAESLK
jgi:hypothetical protein